MPSRCAAARQVEVNWREGARAPLTTALDTGRIHWNIAAG